VKATEQLKEEHEAIKLLLRILEKVSQKIEAKEEIDSKHLEMMLEFIRLFADKCHHGKEEDVLFLALEKAGIPKEGGPIAVMLMEHDEGRGYVRGMVESIEHYRKGDRAALAKFVPNARGYARLLTQHIDKENNVLYVMVEMHIPPNRQKELLKGFEKIEAERIGAGKHEELHESLHYLGNIYLKS